MQTERPRFREDLVAELIEDGGARFIDVADPDSGQMFRFFEVEYSLACAMDGERDVTGIAKWAEEELGLKPSPNEIRTVISTLGSLGYLADGKAAAAAATDHAAAAVAAAPVETPRPATTPVAAEPPARPTPPTKATPPKGVPKANTPASGVKKQPETEKESFNRWDQPTAMGDTDDYLDKGVVTGNKRPHTPVPDVELGNAGGRAAARGNDLPKSDDMELGAPGVTKPAAAKSTGKSADVQLGNAGAAGVSTDLAADMAISPADVKAAVRASQVMKAADVPPELAAELEPAKPTEKKQPEPKAVAKQPEAKPARPDTKPPIAMPTERPVLPKAPPAPGPNKALIALLVLVILGAGGFALWKFVLNKKSDTTASTQNQPPPPPQPTPPPPPPVETAKLVAETSPPEEIKAAGAVQIATIIATDSEVKEGDTIAKLIGFKSSGDKVAMYEKEIGILQKQLADAEKARDAAATDAAKKPHETKIIGLNKMIPDRETKLATARGELDKYLIKAPGAGTVTTVAKANARVTPTDIIATLQRAPVMVATFKTAPDATPDANVLLAVKDSEQKLSCKVVETGGDGTKIACPSDAAPEGTEVTYGGVDTSTPSDAPEPADGSAAPADGSAADGSAADGSAADGSAAEDSDGSAAAAPAKAPAPKAQPRRPAPKVAPKAATDAKATDEKLFPPASTTPPVAPAEPAPAPATP